MEPVEHKAKMKPQPDAPAGLETDGKGNVIPFAQRTPEDQMKAASVKNPEQQAENPAPMQRDQQGQGGTSHHGDPAGKQGGNH